VRVAATKEPEIDLISPKMVGAENKMPVKFDENKEYPLL